MKFSISKAIILILFAAFFLSACSDSSNMDIMNKSSASGTIAGVESKVKVKIALVDKLISQDIIYAKSLFI
jgi:uncharacterized lipoprotein YajG